MKRSLMGIRSRVDRLAEQVEQQSANGVPLEELIAILDEGRRRCAAGIPPPRMTEEEFPAWAESLRVSVRGPHDAALVERLIAGRRYEMERREQRLASPGASLGQSSPSREMTKEQ